MAECPLTWQYPLVNETMPDGTIIDGKKHAQHELHDISQALGFAAFSDYNDINGTDPNPQSRCSYVHRQII